MAGVLDCAYHAKGPIINLNKSTDQTKMKIKVGIVLILFFLIRSFGTEFSETQGRCENDAIMFFNSFGDFLNEDTPEEKSFQISAACTELTKTESYTNRKKNIFTETNHLEPYEFILNNQKIEIKQVYDKRLSEIAHLEKLSDRVKKAYQLATSTFSKLEMENLDVLSKKNGLKNRSAQRAAVLALSLAGVRKKKSEYEIKLFLPKIKIYESSRSWVRITLSNGRGNPTEIDFDPSVSGVQPLPLLPLYKKINENDRITLQTQCERARMCLLNSKK